MSQQEVERTAAYIPPPPPASPQQQNSGSSKILDRSFCLSITRGWPPLSKSVSTEVLQTSADRKMLHAQKDLFKDFQELKQLFALDAKIDAFLERRCLPFPLKRGIYLLPKDFFGEVENELSEHAVLRAQQVDKTASAYERAVDEALAALGDQGQRSDYFTREQFKARFIFKWNYLSFGVSEALKEVGGEVLAREQQKFDAEIRDAAFAVNQLLRVQLQEAVAHMVDRLTPDEDGKKKVFRNTLLNPINEFLASFASRNLADDSKLSELVTQANDLLRGVDPDKLRSDDKLRETVQKGFTAMKARLDELVEEEPERAITFDT